MRIAFVGGFAFSPKGTMRARAHPLAVELVKTGHEVTIFLPPYDNPRDCGREWDLEGVRIKNVHATSSDVTGSVVRKRRYPQMLVELIREVVRYQADVVHIFKPKGFAGAAGTYFLRKRVPVVLDCDDWEGWGGWNDAKSYPWVVKEYIAWQERWMVLQAPAITVASRALENRAIKLRGSNAGVFYLPNCGASAAEREIQESVRLVSPAETRRDLGLPDGPLVLYTGHSGDEENVIALCRAVMHVAHEISLTMALIGDVSEQGHAVNQLRVNANVRLVRFPRLPYPGFLHVVWASDLAVFPYSDDQVHRAKCSARIIDYMAMGKPVLTSAIGQNLEYIVNGEIGILVEPGNVHQFAAEMKRLLADEQLRLRLGANAAARIASKFRWDGDPLQRCLAAYERAFSLCSARWHTSAVSRNDLRLSSGQTVPREERIR